MVDKDRIQGSAEQAKDKVKEVVGKVTGDSKLEGEGKALISSRAKCRTRQVRGCPNAQCQQRATWIIIQSTTFCSKIAQLQLA